MKRLISVLSILLSTTFILAQNISVEYSGSTVGINETFSITIKSTNVKITSWGDFPEINGFKKLNVSSGTQQQVTMDHNGVKKTTSYTITQGYRPTQKGRFNIPNFDLAINKTTYKIRGRQIQVTNARQRRSLFDDFFNQQQYEYNFKEIGDNAFLSVSPTKRSIYVGEGVSLSLDFYMLKSNYGLVEFKQDLGQQLAEIGQKLKLPDCWIESFEITQLEYTEEKLKDKVYLKFHLGDFLLFPNAEHNLKVPSISLNMIKNKISEETDYFGRRHKQAGEKKYRSRPITIKVKPLPPHPLKDQVAIGKYELKENIDKIEVETGGAIHYGFMIHGFGNINMIEAPIIKHSDSLTFFKPTVKQDVRKENGKLYGTKKFDYSIVAELPGVYGFDDRFEWIYFDPIRARYDTLKPHLFAHAIGASLSEIDMEDDYLSDFYGRLETADKKLVFLKDPDYSRWIINLLSLTLLAALGYTYYKKRNG